MKPSEIFTEIDQHTENLKLSRDQIPYNNRPGFDIGQQTSRDTLLTLRSLIKSTYIPNKLVGLFPYGDFNAINSLCGFLISHEGIVLNADDIYSQITDSIEPSYGRDRVFSGPQFNLLIQTISKIGIELGYQQIEYPKYYEKACLTRQDTVKHVKTILRDSNIGDQLNYDLMMNKLVDTITAYKIDSKQIPVLVINTSSVQERNNLSRLFIKSSDYKLTPTFTINQKNVIALFKDQKQDEENTKTEE
jgi:hypothetical protein